MVDTGKLCSVDSDCSSETLKGPELLHLQSQLKSLQRRIEELELENARLSSQMAHCCCRKLQVDGKTIDLNSSTMSNMKVPSLEKERKQSACIFGPLKGSGNGKSIGDSEAERRTITSELWHYSKLDSCRLHVDYPKVCQEMCCIESYVLWSEVLSIDRFYGFASEAQMDPTIEAELFKALQKTKLLVGDKEDFCYSRCGRTDRGVSSIGQVISLFLRSNGKDSTVEEIDYVKVLNKVLPRDIRVLGWCPVSEDFHARFSCVSREYKYLFWKESLDILAMELAAKKFVGEHDFRNFCKMDAANVHNYRRKITSFEISSCNERIGGNEVWAMIFKGSAFLWHQVRCMVAVLFMIGQGLEPPEVVDDLLDVTRTPRKPQYALAPELPLILQLCEFDGLDFICSLDAGQALHEHLKNEYQKYMLQATIFHEASKSLSLRGGSNLGHHYKSRTHVPLMSRPTESSYEERRAKLSYKWTRKSRSSMSSNGPESNRIKST